MPEKNHEYIRIKGLCVRVCVYFRFHFHLPELGGCFVQSIQVWLWDCAFLYLYLFFIYIYMNIYTVYHISTTWVVELWAVLARKFSYNGGILLK